MDNQCGSPVLRILACENKKICPPVEYVLQENYLGSEEVAASIPLEGFQVDLYNPNYHPENRNFSRCVDSTILAALAFVSKGDALTPFYSNSYYYLFSHLHKLLYSLEISFSLNPDWQEPLALIVVDVLACAYGTGLCSSPSLCHSIDSCECSNCGGRMHVPKGMFMV